MRRAAFAQITNRFHFAQRSYLRLDVGLVVAHLAAKVERNDVIGDRHYQPHVMLDQ